MTFWNFENWFEILRPKQFWKTCKQKFFIININPVCSCLVLIWSIFLCKKLCKTLFKIDVLEFWKTYLRSLGQNIFGEHADRDFSWLFLSVLLVFIWSIFLWAELCKTSLAAIHSFLIFGSPLWRICHRFTLLTEQEREVQFKHNINNNIEDRMLARARIERDRVTGTPHHDYSCHFLSTLDLKNFPLCKIGQNPLQNWKVGNLKTDLRSLGQNNFRKHADRNFLWLILSVVV